MTKIIIKLLTFWIPIKEWRKSSRDALNKVAYNVVYNSFRVNAINKKNLIKVKKQYTENKKLKVGFYVIFASVFQSKPLFEAMLKDDMFDPFILVIPDISRGDDNMFSQMDKTYKTLHNTYGNKAKNSYLSKEKSFIDYNNNVDIICFNNPYDNITHNFYTSKYNFNKCLTIYINYFYFGKLKHELHVVKMLEYKLFAKVFLENEYAYKTIKEIHKNNDDKFVVTGYIKMDKFLEKSKNNKKRKSIIIAPHHSVAKTNSLISISNFLIYAEFFIDLAKKYKEVDFVLRPHPLLFVNLENNKIWRKEEITKYLNKIENLPNMSHDTSSDYLDKFAESDGLIHDCGSFLAEYYYTKKPQCYLIRNDIDLHVNFTENGIKMLSYTYKAYNEEQIISFVENIINNDDTMKKERLKYAKDNIVINHPNASNIALEYIKSIIFIANKA